jgi:hypothetical protein
MDVNYHKVYMYDHVRQLTVIGDNFCPSGGDPGVMAKLIVRA